ncbi:MAG: hypothetical protein H6545_06055, partial [Bacteroidales bacterium]|nr:hypothetical protein [Bacteroidales bacterium]
RWCVLGRLGEKEKRISLADLGLEKGNKYLLYEFWSDTFLGTVSDTIRFGSINPAWNCQLFCIRPAQPHPQVVATSRHISCGATDLSGVAWDNNTLSGTSKPVPSVEYVLLVHEPSGYRSSGVTITGGKLISNTRNGAVRRITMVNDDGGEISWKLDYRSGLNN